MRAVINIYMIVTVALLLGLVTAQVRYRARIKAQELRAALIHYYSEQERARHDRWTRPAPPTIYRLRVVRQSEEVEQHG